MSSSAASVSFDHGAPTQAAERLAADADAGATWLVLTTIGDDRHA
jgi:hypothetical protein